MAGAGEKAPVGYDVYPPSAGSLPLPQGAKKVLDCGKNNGRI